LKDKVCLITGAARGIGAAVSEVFLKNGAKICLLDLDGKAVKERAGDLDPAGSRSLAMGIDVTDEVRVQSAFDVTVERFGSLDVLVNCAGILKHLPIEELTLEDFERIIKVNLTALFITCRAAVVRMKKQGGGKIVNIASLGGRTGRPGVGVNYGASKAGVIGLTRTLAREKGCDGIYVNAIAPGPILTELTRTSPKEVFAKWNEGRAVDRDGSPEDIAQAALFLASSLSDWVTGVTLDVNGGIFIP